MSKEKNINGFADLLGDEAKALLKTSGKISAQSRVVFYFNSITTRRRTEDSSFHALKLKISVGRKMKPGRH